MDNYENNNNNEEYRTNSEENQNLPKPYDPASEAKGKIILFVVIVAIMVAAKFLIGQ